MKKIAILLLFISVTVFSFSQELRFGFQFTGTSSWLMNKQVFDDGAGQDVVAASLGRYFGPNVTFKFKNKMAVAIEFNFNKINQKYEGNIKVPLTNDRFYSYNSKISYNSFDIPVLFQIGDKVYFEVGPILHFRGKVNYNREFTNTDSKSVIGEYNTGFSNLHTFANNIDNLDVRTRELANGSNIDLWKSSAFGVAVGVGANIELPLNFIINLGLRANYIFNDMKGVNGLNFAKSDFQSNTKDYSTFKTHPLYAGIKVGVVYKLPL